MTARNFIGKPRLLSLGFIMLALTACASEQSPLHSLPHSSSNLSAPGPEELFATPEQAADALAIASRANDKKSLLKILGPAGAKIINSGDPVADREGRQRFVAAYNKAHKLESETESKETLVVGDEEWPLPIPLVKVSDRNSEPAWQFDTEAGQEEILNRRIGKNELNVIKICRAYVEAQREYADMMGARNGKPVYAQRFISTDGAHDGLYWPVQAGEQESPFGPLIAHAQAEKYDVGKQRPQSTAYHGYYYKVLTQQGPNAAGGAMNYIKNGVMTKGFALLVYPAKYGDSGIMTFIVNQNGIVFEKNFGPKTNELAWKINSYDPDESWKIAAD